MKKIGILILVLSALPLAGCGVRQEMVHIAIPAGSVVAPDGKPAVIDQVTDARADVLGVAMDEPTKTRNVGGVYRAGNGMLVQLDDGSVPEFMQRVAAQSLQNAGYRIVENDPDAMHVKVVVTQLDVQAPAEFWRVYAQRMIADVAADVTITTKRGTTTFQIHGHGTNIYQVLDKANWEIALDKAVADFSRQLQSRVVLMQ